MSSSRRARVSRAEHEDVPAFDAARLLQPEAYFDVQLIVLPSYESESAGVGQRVFETFCHIVK